MSDARRWPDESRAIRVNVRRTDDPACPVRRRWLAAGGCGALAALAGAPAQARRSGDPRALRVAFPIPETGFDPVQVQDAYSIMVLAHIVDPPLRWDHHARPATLRPNTLAAMPEVSADHRTVTLRVQPGIYFQDDPAFGGKRRELVAADYVYSWKRIFDPRWKSPQLFDIEPERLLGLSELRQAALKSKAAFDYDREIEGLRALDRYTLQVRLGVAAPRFVYKLTTPLFGAVAREVVERYGDDIMAHPVGTGAYRLAKWTRSSRIVLERNPAYRDVRYDFAAADDAPDLAEEVAALRGRRMPLLDRVEISIIQESQPRWLAFEQGELDTIEVPADFLALAAPGGQIAPFLARRGVRMRITPLPDVALSYFNMDDPMVGGYQPHQVALRRAIALGFDGAHYIANIRHGFATRAHLPFAPGSFGFDPAVRSEMGTFDRARARALLDTYGYVDRDGDGWRERPDGGPLKLVVSSSPTQLDRRQNELWKRYMDAIGIRTEFNIAQWPELLKQSLAGKLMMWSYSWQLSTPDSDLLLGMAYGPNIELNNDSRFDLPAFNALYDTQRRLPDGPERLAAMREAGRLMVAYMPYLLHYHRHRIDLVQPWLRGHRLMPFTSRLYDTVDIDTTRA